MRRRHHDAITEKLAAGLTVQRIFQDLVEDFGYGHSYESVKRYVRKLEPTRRAGRGDAQPPGKEAQVDFFQGPPTSDGKTGQWRRPWVFRMTLCHSRHGYEEAVWDQKLETFLAPPRERLPDLGGVPGSSATTISRPAVVRACFYDPDINPVYAAFAQHWGFTPLPTRPRNPQENGKQERSGGYVKDNALKGRRFDSLDEQNAFLAALESHDRAAADPRHDPPPGLGALLETTRRPCARSPPTPSPSSARHAHGASGRARRGRRQLLSRAAAVCSARRARPWDGIWCASSTARPGRCARPRPAGEYAPAGPGGAARRLSPAGFRREAARAAARASARRCKQWAEAALPSVASGPSASSRASLALTRKHPREAVLRRRRPRSTHRLFRYKDLAGSRAGRAGPRRLPLTADDPSIRP